LPADEIKALLLANTLIAGRRVLSCIESNQQPYNKYEYENDDEHLKDDKPDQRMS